MADKEIDHSDHEEVHSDDEGNEEKKMKAEAEAEEKSRIAKSLQEKVENLLQTGSGNEWVLKFLDDIKDNLIVDNHDEVGGILPVCVDPETLESYFLMGVESIRKKDCRNYLEEMFFDSKEASGKLKTHIRNALCHFHGWIDPYETHSQGCAREGYEESRGIIGNQVDLWRCLMLSNDFSVTDEELTALKFISLGFMNQKERLELVNAFHTLELTGPAMAEMNEIKFVPIQKFYEEMQRVTLFNIFRLMKHGESTHYLDQCNFTKVDPESFQPNNCYWLRLFLMRWFTFRATPKDAEVLEDVQPENIKQFPTIIQLPNLPFPISLVQVTSDADLDYFPRCRLCTAGIHTPAFYYGHAPGDEKVNYRAHIRCALVQDHENKWRIRNEFEIQEILGKLRFFESNFISFLRNPENYSIQYPDLLMKNEIFPNLKSIKQLPSIDGSTRNILEQCFHFRDEFLPKDKEYQKKNCRYCQRIFFCPMNKDKRKSCFPCMMLSEEIARRKEEKEKRFLDKTQKKPFSSDNWRKKDTVPSQPQAKKYPPAAEKVAAAEKPVGRNPPQAKAEAKKPTVFSKFQGLDESDEESS